MTQRMPAQTVRCDNNGGCGECSCACHTDVEDPGPHIATCKFAEWTLLPAHVVPEYVDA